MEYKFDSYQENFVKIAELEAANVMEVYQPHHLPCPTISKMHIVWADLVAEFGSKKTGGQRK